MPVRHIVVIPSWYGSGRGPGGGYFRDQALALQQAGFRVAMLAPDIHTLRDLRQGSAPAARGWKITVEDDAVPTWRRSGLVLIPRLPYRNAVAWAWGGLRLFAQYVARNGVPDLIHAHSALNAGIVALAIKRRYGIPFVLTEHSTSFAQGRLRWWERDLVRWVVAAARRCIAVSPQLARLLEVQYPGSTWAYLPNPLGEAFLSGAAAPSDRRSPGPFVFLSVARMSAEKGFARLIEAFAEAFCGTPEIRLRLAGDGPLRGELERLSHQRGIAAQVDFLGDLPSTSVRDEMQAADAFVLASDFESFGVVVIEALACGRPVVVTRSGGPDHLVNPGNGLLIPIRDGEALRGALREMRRRAGDYDPAAIRVEALSLYGPEAFARQFATLVALNAE
jgi:glycosyltransferase involved in cell wall biosynthesis